LQEKVEQRSSELAASNRKLRYEVEARKRVAVRLVDLLEEDRREVAMLLHDEVGQILTSIKMDLEIMASDITDSPVLERMQSARDKVVHIMKIIKDTAANLRPSVLENLGLVPAVQFLVDNTKAFAGFDVGLYIKGLEKRLGPEKELALYRILQEALTNAAKHSRANAVFINLIRRGETITLTVEDDGIGFQMVERPLEQNGSGKPTLGLSIMRERAKGCDGFLTIDSRVGKGTQILVEIPCPEIND
jgi:signal transduction histidine kinase